MTAAVASNHESMHSPDAGLTRTGKRAAVTISRIPVLWLDPEGASLLVADCAYFRKSREQPHVHPTSGATIAPVSGRNYGVADSSAARALSLYVDPGTFTSTSWLSSD